MLPFLILQLVVATLANPFHKYPYVFLLDVGNEEIEKANTEQIRLSIPGGSLALKYPATGDGDTIGHVRVSGIDFGTELKASIVQGGPGYKYVVLVFMGNPGESYDAVVTIQTVANVDDSGQLVSNMDSGAASEELEDDPNNSAEDTSEIQTKHLYSENSQTMQSSSNIYEYTRNDGFKGQNTDDDDTPGSNDDDEESEDEDNDNEDPVDEINNDNSDQNVDLQLTNNENDYPEDNSNVNDHVYNQNSNRYGKYEAFKPFIIGGVRFYPQAGQYIQDGYSKSIHDQENHNNGYGDEDNEIDKDTNNNVDSDYGSLIEY